MAAVSVTIDHRLYKGLGSAVRELTTDVGAPLPVGLPGREDTQARTQGPAQGTCLGLRAPHVGSGLGGGGSEDDREVGGRGTGGPRDHKGLGWGHRGNLGEDL